MTYTLTKKVTVPATPTTYAPWLVYDAPNRKLNLNATLKSELAFQGHTVPCHKFQWDVKLTEYTNVTHSNEFDVCVYPCVITGYTIPPLGTLNPITYTQIIDKATNGVSGLDVVFPTLIQTPACDYAVTWSVTV